MAVRLKLLVFVCQVYYIELGLVSLKQRDQFKKPIFPSNAKK